MLISVVIRTLNEAKYLPDLLSGIKDQVTEGLEVEIIIVDSGSQDGTLEIAHKFGCKVVHIQRHEFSFGRSLNFGCSAASGEIFVVISGHCVPCNDNWLLALCQPLMSGVAVYAYGRQVGGEQSRYSECRIFAKYYPPQSRIPQEGFYCNNANAAITRSAWEKQQFDEELTGLEDMDLAQRLVEDGQRIAYVAEASVFHYHDETWTSVKRRFEREAIALRKIMPQVHIHRWDLFRYILSSVCLDLNSARKDRLLASKAVEIVLYRVFQYWGSYVGNHDHRRLSHEQKEEYYYPGGLNRTYEEEYRCPAANESQQ